MSIQSKLCGLLLAVIPVVAASADEEHPLEALVLGKYSLIGSLGDTAYKGVVELGHDGSGMVITRVVDENTSTGTAAFEYATADKITVLRLRFPTEKMESTCLVQSDLDNYARFTCYRYPEHERTEAPAIEALFPYHEEK